MLQKCDSKDFGSESVNSVDQATGVSSLIKVSNPLFIKNILNANNLNSREVQSLEKENQIPDFGNLVLNQGSFAGKHPPWEVFESLKCTREGLSSDAVQEQLELFQYNKLKEEKENKILEYFGFMWNTLSWVMEVATLMAIILTQFGILRDGKWSVEDAVVLVAGDIINIKIGDIVLVNARHLERDRLKIDQVSDYEVEIEVMQNVTKEEYLASLRRKNSDCSRGVSKYRGVRMYFFL